MKLEKAIKILAATLELPENFPRTDYTDAVKLGLEALKAWHTLREGRQGIYNPTLPSETS